MNNLFVAHFTKIDAVTASISRLEEAREVWIDRLFSPEWPRKQLYKSHRLLQQRICALAT